MLKHRQDTPKWQPTHEVEIDGRSWVGGITGCDTLKVNSYHHQSIKDLADGLVISSRSSDGIVEAVESRDFSERWLVGVQWHAEAMRGSGRGASQPVRGARLGGGEPRSAPGCLERSPVSPRGIFVTVEGLDFSGKSTLVRHLRPLLAERAELPVHFTREPGGTPAAERIREILLDPAVDMDAWTEAYLYAAARADHARREILPRLERGETVICERYLDSSLAYQGRGRGLGLQAVQGPQRLRRRRSHPRQDFLHAPGYHGAGASRAGSSGRRWIVWSSSERSSCDSVESGFEELVRLEPDRIRVLDAARPTEDLANIVLQELRSLQYTRGGGESGG